MGHPRRSDSNKHAYIQRAWRPSLLLYLKETLGPAVAEAQLAAWVTKPALDLLAAGDAVVVRAAARRRPHNLVRRILRERVPRLSGHP